MDPPSIHLADFLHSLHLPIERFTTGTPPRLHRDSIDWSRLGTQASDDPAVPLSFLNIYAGDFIPNQSRLVRCATTYTNEETHAICNAHRGELPSFTGNRGRGQGPRYCPSIEKKVLRFPEIPAVRCAAIRLLTRLPAVLLDVPCEEVSFPAALQEAMATLKTAGMQEAASAAGNVAEMLSNFVARSSEKPRVRRDESTEGVSSGGISVETAVQWLMTRLQHCGGEPRG